MRFIDSTLYASRRSLSELELVAAAGAMAVVEPITWQGLDRRFPETYQDDFERLIVSEARRAFSIRLGYAACLAVPAREARHLAVARRVIDLMPRFLGHERVAAIGEVGLEVGDAAEEEVFRLQARLARHHALPVVARLPVHDRGPLLQRMMAILGEEGLPPGRVLFNGAAEDVLPILRGVACWYGLSVGAPDGLSVDAAVQLLVHAGPERAMIHSAAGRMGGDMLAVPRTARQLLGLGYSPEGVERVIYHHPRAFFSQARPLPVVETPRHPKAGWRSPEVVDPELKVG